MGRSHIRSDPRSFCATVNLLSSSSHTMSPLQGSAALDDATRRTFWSNTLATDCMNASRGVRGFSRNINLGLAMCSF